MKITSVKGALRQIITTKGVNILRNGKQCMSILKDMVIKDKDELENIKVVFDKNLQILLLDANSESIADKQNAINIMNNTLISLINEQSARELCSMFVYALDWNIIMESILYEQQQPSATGNIMFDISFPERLIKKSRFILAYQEYAKEYSLKEEDLIVLYDILCKVYREYAFKNPAENIPVNSQHGETYQHALDEYKLNIKRRDELFYHEVLSYLHSTEAFKVYLRRTVTFSQTILDEYIDECMSGFYKILHQIT